MGIQRILVATFLIALGAMPAVHAREAAQATATPDVNSRADLVSGKIPGVPELDTKKATEDVCKKRFPDYTPVPNGACYWRVWGCVTQLEPQLRWIAGQTRHCIPNDAQGYICGVKFIFSAKHYLYQWWHQAAIQKVEETCKEEMDGTGAGQLFKEIPKNEKELIEKIGY